MSARVSNIITMTDEGDSPDARSSRKPARDERDRHFERVEKVLYWVRRTRARIFNENHYRQRA
jgi:hypothetical protein